MIGSKLRRLRNDRGYSQEYLADRLKVSQATLSNIESGKTKPDINVLLAACEEFQIDITALLDDGKTIYQTNHEKAVGYIADTQNFYVSDKLIEQYEARIKELHERISELKEQAAFLKGKQNDA